MRSLWLAQLKHLASVELLQIQVLPKKLLAVVKWIRCLKYLSKCCAVTAKHHIQLSVTVFCTIELQWEHHLYSLQKRTQNISLSSSFKNPTKVASSDFLPVISYILAFLSTVKCPIFYISRKTLFWTIVLPDLRILTDSNTVTNSMDYLTAHQQGYKPVSPVFIMVRLLQCPSYQRITKKPLNGQSNSLKCCCRVSAKQVS